VITFPIVLGEKQYMIQGYDISNVNGYITIPSDADFVIAKVTQDSSFVDRLYPLHRTNARQREIGFGGYHYGDNKAQPSASDSCDFFLLHLGEQQQGEIAALDVESDFGYGGFTPGNPNNLPWIVEWGQEFIDQTGYKPKLYTSIAGITDFGLNHPDVPLVFDLWLAWWTSSGQAVNPPPAPEPFKDYKLWQYNADTIDKNKFLGTLEQFRDTGKMPLPPPDGHDYEALYWAPIYDIITEMVSNSQYPHADAALHANISNAITLHKIALGVESSE
jgi:GH25 family lysozyme M1 (1,4-beta-N-acetylmuramidase)